MPGIARKLHITAAADGLLIHPISSREKTSESLSVRLAYGTAAIGTSTLDQESEGDETSVEAHGIIGLLDLVTTKYLICITRREQVAQVKGKPIYVVTDITLISLGSHADAVKTVKSAATLLRQGKDAVHDDSDDGESEDVDVADINEELPEHSAEAYEAPKQADGPAKETTSFLKNVVQNRGKYGRFAGNWFSKGNTTTKLDQEPASPTRVHAKLVTEEVSEAQGGKVEERTDASSGGKRSTPKSNIDTLAPRLLRSAKLFFSSRSFFFSYDYDLSTSLSRQSTDSSSLPLHRRFEENFFWNRNLLRPFIDSSQNFIILPVIQGFVGQRAFSIDHSAEGQDAAIGVEVKVADVVAAHTEASGKSTRSDLLITLISRRSVKRAGLRYLRRGVDDNGNVANYVESEQILSHQDWNPESRVHSLLQLRGSIPLFFSQTPYSAKPVPVMFGSESTNHTALKKHLASVAGHYGQVQVASLVDKSGVEKDIGEAYENGVKWLNESKGLGERTIDFEWFYFHKECGGMKFENVSILLNTLQKPLTAHGWTTQQSGKLTRQQSGILRTNCMDCLDRTNVTQSAVGAWILGQQLAEDGLQIDLQTDPKTKWFNTLWADNGDAISKQYAGTAALKGDFTRTRKRNWTGALSDLSLTLNRYYNNIFGDYFLQTCIDFYLGSVGPAVFDEFESNMMSQDYALDMNKVRQNAIDACVKIVLENPKEDLLHGWALSCPHEANSLGAMPFEECVLLLTDVALYFCRFDWSTEKVGSFERVDLTDITEIWRGVYITSTLAPIHMDESKNVGFALRYKTNGHALVRTNTRSMDNEKAVENAEHAPANDITARDNRLLAFKALPAKSSAAKQDTQYAESVSEHDSIAQTCDEVHRAIMKIREIDHLDLAKAPTVQEKDVQSLADARKATGYIETLGYSLKKLVWA